MKRVIKDFKQFINSSRSKRLFENSTPEYDEILDLYNSVGLEGMSKDEIDFLKSGGKTKLPNRFKTRAALDKHIETTRSHEDWQRGIAGMASSISGKEANAIIPTKGKEAYDKIRKLKRFLRQNPDWEIDYPYEGVAWGIGTLFQILFRDISVFDELVDILYGDREGYEMDDAMIKMVHIRTRRDWSKEHNNHREPADIPGPEYRVAVTIPKNWYTDLFID